jgi:hypothetical protein
MDCHMVKFMVQSRLHFRCLFALSTQSRTSVILVFIFHFFLLSTIGGSIRSNHTRELLDLFPAAAIVVGVTSFAYHASYTWFFQFWDFVGMYVFLGLPITINLLTAGFFNRHLKRRILSLSVPVAFYLAYVILFSASVIVFKALNIKFQMVTLSQMIVVAAQFVYFASSEQFRHVLTPVVGAFVCFVLAIASNLLDQNGTWCDPHSIIQGHSVWHFWAAMALVYIWRVHYLIARVLTVGQIKE